MSYNVVDQSTGERKQVAGTTLTAIYADSPIGVILPYGGDTAPTGYLECNGSAVSRTTYADLYAVIGTKYGEGDGSTTFNLPDAEAGAALYPVGDADGLEISQYIIKALPTALPADFEARFEIETVATQAFSIASGGQYHDSIDLSNISGKILGVVGIYVNLDSGALPCSYYKITNNVLDFYFRDVGGALSNVVGYFQILVIR